MINQSINSPAKSAEEAAAALLRFIGESPTAFHAVSASVKRLQAAGYTRIDESEPFFLKPGCGYFITRNSSSLIAFFIPPQPASYFRICASHSDSPTFKIKENPEMTVEDAYTKLNVEQYGGAICAPWMDRPLSVAGRLFSDQGGRLVQHLVCANEDMLLIPNLAIHMNREVNKGYAFNVQKDMLPLYQCGPSDGSFLARIAAVAGLSPDDVLGHDLFLYNRQPGTLWGPEHAFISAPRLDDLQCAFSSLTGFLHAKKDSYIAVHCMFDNEEVGSGTRQGAASSFLSSVLSRIIRALRPEEPDAWDRALTKSFLLSADNAHAVHPNHPDKADPVNRPYINRGVVLKFSAAQKYCTDGFSAAFFRLLGQKAGVPIQFFTNRSDMPGGSTLGNIATTLVGMPAADIGLAQLAMHSPYETAGTQDTLSMIRLLESFFE